MTMNEVNDILKLYNLRLRKRKNGEYWVRRIGTKKWFHIASEHWMHSAYVNQRVCEYLLAHSDDFN
jgi:hypothetical protein